jgi:hypothetical protein
MLVTVVSNDGLTRKKLPFAERNASADFQRQLVIHLGREFDARRAKHIPAENVQVFQHGRGWNFQRQEKEGFNPHSGHMELQSSKASIEIDRILAHDVTLISDFVRKIADNMEDQFESGLIREIADSAQEAGNTVSIPKDGMTGEAFLEMIRRASVLVGRDGKVSRPSLFLPPGVFEKMLRDLEQLGPEFKAKVEVVWKEKEEEALEREAKRLARYDQAK